MDDVKEKIVDADGSLNAPKRQEVLDTLADIQKAKTMLGWTPKIAFEQGLKQTYEYFKKE